MQRPHNAHPATSANRRSGGWLRNSSITAKLATIVLMYVLILVALLGIVALCLEIAAGVRAYVGGEGLWSKGQKDAVYYLARYAQTQDAGDYRKFQQAITIPLGDRQARIEMLKQEYDFTVVEQGFIQGGNAAEDIPEMLFLFRHFGQVSYLAAAIRIWTEADDHIQNLLEHAEELHAGIQGGTLTPARSRRLRNEIEQINTELTRLERDFSATLAEGARWIQDVLLAAILASAALMLVIGLWLSFRISHALRGGILRLHEGANRVSAGDLAHRIPLSGRDELGQLAAALNTMIEHRQQAESAIKASMQEARTVIDTAYDAYVGMDAAGRICDWNKQAEFTFGWLREEVLGQQLANCIIPPAHRAAHRRGIEHYLLTGEGPVLNRRIEVTALHRDGREFPVELTIWPFRVGDEQRFNAFLHDITERHRMIRRLDAQKSAATALVTAPGLAEAMPAVLDAVCEALEWDVGAFWIPDPHAGVLRCAEIRHRAGREIPLFTEITRKITFAPGIGLPGRVWSTGKPAWIPDVTRDSNFPRAPYAAKDQLHGAFAFPAFSGREVTGVVEFFSGSIQQPDDNLMQMMDTLGSLLGLFVARKRAEEELSTHAAELARSNEELERFAYVASHDLQEPLRTVTSYTQMLTRKYAEDTDPEAREYSAYIVDAAQRMRELIEGLLAYSRVSRSEQKREPADLTRLLETALANLKGAIRDSGATVTQQTLPTLSVYPQQITQLFQNLIGNAIKFRDHAPPRIEVGAARKDGSWVISVRDHGIGVDPKHAERIFVLFQRLHTRDIYPGSGLGLAICKKIVDRHGGRIWVEPANPGSVFRFTLPA